MQGFSIEIIRVAPDNTVAQSGPQKVHSRDLSALSIIILKCDGQHLLLFFELQLASTYAKVCYKLKMLSIGMGEGGCPKGPLTSVLSSFYFKTIK